MNAIISIIILNYNGERWLKRCLASLGSQTIFKDIEIIVADNASPDGSAILAAELIQGWPNARVIQHGENLGFCEGNNRAAASAKGSYLLFLNNDTWLEPHCLEKLVRTVEEHKAQAAAPLILDYDENTIQSSGADGFDIFGLMSLSPPHDTPRQIFVAGGCSYFIRRDVFETLGGFDRIFYMYAEEYDLSWRACVAGALIISVPGARLHHRGAANVNPAGGQRTLELRTSDTKRFYTNRNQLLLLLKNCRNVLLILVPMQLMLLTVEAMVLGVVVRRWSFLKRAYLDAVVDCWGLRRHILQERRRLNSLRKLSDLRMLRFFRLRLNRWDELKLVWQRGTPKVEAS